MSDDKIDISAPKKEFAEFLNLENNTRVIFSGPFGTGKTYFLKEFFAERKATDSAIYVYPVNYTIAANEDIMELIKFDILFQLLQMELEFEKNEFKTLFTLQFFLGNSQLEILKEFAEKSSEIGKSVAGIVDTLIKLTKGFKEFAAEMEGDEFKKGLEFFKSIKNKPGGIYEEDPTTEMIRSLVSQLQEKKKKVYFIIDDMDRIDPEHSFRILNVFAAHFDNQSSGAGVIGDNKFGFDCIVTVCDIINLRHIFHSKYGVEVDFTGYIDKFYTRHIFSFDNTEMISNQIYEIIRGIKVFDRNGNPITLNTHADYSYSKVSLQYIFLILIKSKCITLRSLSKLRNQTLALKYPNIFYGLTNRNGYVVNPDVMVIYSVLCNALGSYHSVQTALLAAAETNVWRSTPDRSDIDDTKKLNDLMPFLVTSYPWPINPQNIETLLIPDQNLIIKYRVTPQQSTVYYTIVEYANIDDGLVRKVGINFLKLLKSAFENLEKHRVIIS